MREHTVTLSEHELSLFAYHISVLSKNTGRFGLSLKDVHASVEITPSTVPADPVWDSVTMNGIRVGNRAGGAGAYARLVAGNPEWWDGEGEMKKSHLTMCGLRPRASMERVDGEHVRMVYPCGYVQRVTIAKDKNLRRVAAALLIRWTSPGGYWTKVGGGVADECPRCRRAELLSRRRKGVS